MWQNGSKFFAKLSALYSIVTQFAASVTVAHVQVRHVSTVDARLVEVVGVANQVGGEILCITSIPLHFGFCI